ncbi:MAG TPA: DUF6069 family protein [Candidatus Limnocylindrales bacterium]|nr:DUF6069 family protein [Candidatus Limnocylindrales bacterium]
MRNTRIQRVAAVGGATVAALVAWTFIHVVSDVDLAVQSGDSVTHVGAAAVAATAIFVGLAGWALLALLERYTTRPRPIWIGVAVAVFLLSLLGPLGGVNAAAIGSLSALHAVVAAALIAGLSRTARRRVDPTQRVAPTSGK